MIIRGYEEKDKKSVQKVCIDTAPSCDTDKKKAVTLALYCNSYIEREPQWCYVCENEFGEVKGYILCSPNYKTYETEYRKYYLNNLKKIGMGIYLYKRLELRTIRRFYSRFPAHLHIDIDESMQRQGVGHKLMDALLEKLRSEGIKGVFLICNSKNEKGCGFYEKYGFTIVDRMSGSVAYGMLLY